MLLERLPSSTHLKFQISNLKSLAENISCQLRGWSQSMQDSNIKGTRYLNSRTRKLEKARQDREEMMKELRRIQTGTGS
jgi:hypothetical protein